MSFSMGPCPTVRLQSTAAPTSVTFPRINDFLYVRLTKLKGVLYGIKIIVNIVLHGHHVAELPFAAHLFAGQSFKLFDRHKDEFGLASIGQDHGVAVG